MPKANMYQSLHTTVVRPNGEPAEIQIRTTEMHRICEYGVAAHWSYKEKRESKVGSADLEKFSWLRQIVQWQSELKDPDEFLEAVKVDLFDEEIFVFTPKGDVISLPNNATALDFAFAVHTDVGLRTIGAKVNSVIAPIKRVLKSGDIVEILTSPNQKPSKDWLNFIVTSKARNKIRGSLRSVQRDKSLSFGRDMLEQALVPYGLNIDKVLKAGDMEKFVRQSRESNFDDAMIAIGYGKIDADELVSHVYPKPKPKDTLEEQAKKGTITGKTYVAPSNRKKDHSGILVSGIDNVLVNFGKCCNPLPGESIVGFITRGRGVTVHRSSCSRALDIDPHRRIDVSWADDANMMGLHTAYIRILTRDRTGVLAEVTSAISNCSVNIQKAEVQVNKDFLGILDFELGLQNLNQLEAVIAKVERVPSVVSVERKSIIKQKKR
jgi:guanosine-3',5'-bis(diphosphate) 3'-pyrophosphohydrolase